jgi:DNA invertase Pin-like site-specific DNA recombinase
MADDVTMVALYARVSTDDKGQDPEMQLGPLRAYCKTREWVIFKEYVDEGWSGADSTRPALTELKQDAHRGKFRVVLVWAFDRFARSILELILALDTFRAQGIDFRSHTQDIDTTTPFGRVIFAIIAAMAELERELFSERVTAGIERAREKGVQWGRPRAEVDLSQISERRARGESWTTIAIALGVSKDTCRRVFQAAQKAVEKTTTEGA